MANVLALVNGVPRMTVTAVTYVAVYDASITLVSTVTSGTAITLPSGQQYNSTELNIFLNGQKLDPADYTYVGSVPRTQVSFGQNLVAGDLLEFQIERAF